MVTSAIVCITFVDDSRGFVSKDLKDHQLIKSEDVSLKIANHHGVVDNEITNAPMNQVVNLTISHINRTIQ